MWSFSKKGKRILFQSRGTVFPVWGVTKNIIFFCSRLTFLSQFLHAASVQPSSYPFIFIYVLCEESWFRIFSAKKIPFLQSLQNTASHLKAPIVSNETWFLGNVVRMTLFKFPFTHCLSGLLCLLSIDWMLTHKWQERHTIFFKSLCIFPSIGRVYFLVSETGERTGQGFWQNGLSGGAASFFIKCKEFFSYLTVFIWLYEILYLNSIHKLFLAYSFCNSFCNKWHHWP